MHTRTHRDAHLSHMPERKNRSLLLFLGKALPCFFRRSVLQALRQRSEAGASLSAFVLDKPISLGLVTIS